jgi:hypothetical protein
MDQFYEALGKDIEHTLTPAFRDLREDSYQPSEPQQVTALPAATLREFFDDASHIQVTMQQGGNSLYVLDPEANRNRAQWSVATAREMFGREFSADARRRLTVSEERGREELRYRQLEITTLTQDHPPLLAERQFTFLTIGAALRWPRYEQSLLLPLQPISILVPPDRSTYERSYQFALSTLLTELTDVSGFRWHDPGSETEDNPMNRR